MVWHSPGLSVVSPFCNESVSYGASKCACTSWLILVSKSQLPCWWLCLHYVHMMYGLWLYNESIMYLLIMSKMNILYLFCSCDVHFMYLCKHFKYIHYLQFEIIVEIHYALCRMSITCIQGKYVSVMYRLWTKWMDNEDIYVSILFAPSELFIK